jgi:MFS family permease
MLAACVAVAVVPILIFGIRNHPSDLGLFPDGATSEPIASSSGQATRVWSTSEVLRNPSYWLIGSSLGLLFLSYVGVLSNLHKYATELGVDVKSASALISMIAAAGFVGKLIFGWVADLISLRVGLWLAQALAATGIAILSIEPAYPTMVVAAILMGLAAGGMLPVWGAMVAAAFGVASYGRVMGLIMPVIAVCTFPGPILAARSMDATDSYELAMRGFVLAIAVAAAMLIPLRLDADTRPGISP